MKHLKHILAARHRRAGMRLFERDDHTMELRLRGATVARFSATGVTQDTIRLIAERHLNERHLKE